MEGKKIMVAYATTSGSTQEIAEFVAAELKGQNLDVDVHPCKQVSSLDGYSAVVLGAALYMFHLHGDAVRFLKWQQKSLSALPVAIFAGGVWGPNAAKDALDARKNLDAELAKFAWLHPVSVQLVGGKFDPAKLRFPYNLIPALKQMPPSDVRDWEEIRAWARGLPGQFGSQPATPVT